MDIIMFNKYNNQTITGELFNEEYNDTQFVILLNRNRMNKNYEYHIGGIQSDYTDISFIPKDIFPYWLYYKGQLMYYICNVTIPKEANVFIKQYNLLGDKIIIKDIIPIKHLQCWNNIDFCIKAMKWNKYSFYFINGDSMGNNNYSSLCWKATDPKVINNSLKGISDYNPFIHINTNWLSKYDYVDMFSYLIGYQELLIKYVDTDFISQKDYYKLCIKAVNYPISLKYINGKLLTSYQYKKVCYKAINKNLLTAFQYVDLELIDRPYYDKLCILSIKKNKQDTFKYIEPKYIHKEHLYGVLCLVALKLNINNVDYINLNYIDDKIRQTIRDMKINKELKTMN
jgi:hypothetical protein